MRNDWSLWAIVFRPWPDEPVYHEPGIAFSGQRRNTRCGRPIGEFTPWLPKKHVVKFARPCKSCYPGGSTP